MTKPFKLLCTLALYAAPALGQGVLVRDSVTTSATNVQAGSQAPVYTVPYAQIRVCANSFCASLTPVYRDAALTQQIAQPVVADAQGKFSFYLAPGSYFEQISTPGGSVLGTYPIAPAGGGSTSSGAPLPASGLVVATSPYSSRSATSTDITNVLGFVPVNPSNNGTDFTNPTQFLFNIGAVPLLGGQLSGPLFLAADPTQANQAVTKNYVDTHAGSGGGAVLPASGLVVATSPTSGRSATTADITGTLGFTPANKAGDTLTGPLVLASDPTTALQAASKGYVDNNTVSKAGGSMTGLLLLSGAPTASNGAVTKSYADAASTTNATAAANAQATANAALPKTGGALTGALTLAADPTTALGAASKNYVDSTTVTLSGDTMTGALILSGTPTAALQAAPKSYVDTATAADMPRTGGNFTSAITVGGQAVCLANGTNCPSGTGGGSGGGTNTITLTVTGAVNGTNAAFALSNGQTATFVVTPGQYGASDYVTATEAGTNGTVTVYLNGVPQVLTTDYTLTGTATSGNGGGGGGGSGTTANCGTGATPATCGSMVATAPTTAASTGQAATGTALSACQALTTSGTYYLTQDVTCTTQGFAIGAANVVLNLNGHTITYGNPNSIIPAVSMCDGYYVNGNGFNAGLPAAACTSGSKANPIIENGTITQAANAAQFTHAFYLGQASSLNGGTIQNLTVNLSAVGSEFIFGDYGGPGWTVQNNVVNSAVSIIQGTLIQTTGTAAANSYTVTVASGASNMNTYDVLVGTGIPYNTQIQAISGNVLTLYAKTTQALPAGTPVHTIQSPLGAREVNQGYAVNMGGGSASGAGNVYKNNVINGGPQGGIIDSNGNSLMDHNTINLTSSYSNDYGVLASAASTTVTNNTITGRSRGLSMEATGVHFEGNYVSVHEENNNPEYGCEFQGAYALRMKQFVSSTGKDTYKTVDVVGNNTAQYTNFDISGNYFSADATYCEAHGMTLTNMTAGVTGNISSNVFKTTGGSANVNSAILINGSMYPAITFASNTYQGGSIFQGTTNGDINYPSYQLSIPTGQTYSWDGSGPTYILQDFSTADGDTSTEVFSAHDTIAGTLSVQCASSSIGTASSTGYTHTCSGGH